MDYEEERKRILAEFREAQKRETWSNLINTVVAALMAGSLAWWAYGTIAHAVLFAFITYAISGVGNAVVGEIRRSRLQAETRELLWRSDERLKDDIQTGRTTRRG